MPDPSQSDALVRSRITNPNNIREIETLEIVQPSVSYQNEQLDVVFLVDLTGSMNGIIQNVKNSLNSAVELLSDRFSSIRFGLVTFKDEDEIFFVPDSELQSKDEIITELNLLDSDGGGDNPEAGYFATVRACEEISWRQQRSVLRTIVLVSDETSHERGATKEEAIASLKRKKVRFFYTRAADSSYLDLAEETNGQKIPYSNNSNTFANSLADALLSIETIEGKDPIYLINDSYEFTANTEENLEVTYLPRAFEIGISGEGTTGVRTINITIDNTDLAVSKYLASAIKNNLPIEIVYRLYLSSDPIYPQNNPPLRVFLTNVEISGSTVSGELNWIDLTNATFPNTFYIKENFPSL
jgi:hypothetical protein